MHDLADDPRYAAVREQLEREVLRGWDPEAIESQIERAIADKAMLRDWARQVDPPSTHLWPMQPDQNRLDPQ